jgi:hypothetical protein
MAIDLLSQVEASLGSKRVGIVEFAESDEYCNRPLYPRQRVLLKLFFLEELTGEEEDVLDYWIAGGRNGTEIVISPNIRERVQWLRDNGYPHFREVVLVGGRRSSKGYVTGIAMAKVMFDCLQLQDPGRHYGIDPTKNIMFACVAGSEQQAKEYQFGDLSNTIEGCAAFDPYRVRTLETEIRVATTTDLRKLSRSKSQGSKVMRDIARLRGVALAANAGTLRGMAAMALCIDEMAHMIPGESKASADEVYNAAEPSMDQFGGDAMTFCNSSPYSKVGKFYERFVDAMRPFDPDRAPGIMPVMEDENSLVGEDMDLSEVNGNPALMTFEFPSWALFEGYQGSGFKEAVTVSADWDPHEKDEQGRDKWSAGDKRKILGAKQAEAANPDVYKVERRAKFAEVTDAYLNPAMVDQAFAGVPDGWDEDPVNKTKRPRLTAYRTNYGEGVLNVFRYKFHVDPSSTTAGFGFAIGHTEQFPSAYGVDEEHVVFDLIKRWNPKDFPGAVIRWKPILDELEQLARIFIPYEITFDQHQSAEPIQDLQERLTAHNLPTRVYEKFATNELNWKRAEVFKTALYQGLVHAPADALGIVPYGPDQELKFLQQVNTGSKYPRVDRQEIGPVQTKDMADCMFEVVEALIGNLMANRTRDRLAMNTVVTGSQGGYQIGGHGGAQVADQNLMGYYNAKKTGEQRRAAARPDWLNAGAGARVGRGRGRPRGARW